MQKCFSLLFLMISFQADGQEIPAYKCSCANGRAMNMRFSPSQTIKNQNKEIRPMKLEVFADRELLWQYTLYKFGKKLYILDETSTGIHPPTDQVLFGLPMGYNYPVRLYGIFQDINLVYEKNLIINDREFYTYSGNSMVKTPYLLTKLVLDKNLDICEWQIKGPSGTCQCNKKDVIVRLR